MGGLLGALLYKLGKLRYPTASQDINNTATHNNQHEQAPPYPPAALVLSLHLPWTYILVLLLPMGLKQAQAFGALSPLLVLSIGASE